MTTDQDAVDALVAAALVLAERRADTRRRSEEADRDARPDQTDPVAGPEPTDPAARPDRADALDLVARAAAVRTHADAALAALVDAARDAGATWQDIGRTLGTSRQAAFQRFGHPTDPRTGELMDTTPLAGAGDLAAQVFADIAAARYAAVAERFDERMAGSLDADGVGAVWAQVASAVGSFEGAGEPAPRRLGDLTVVDVPLRFEAGDMIGRVALHPDSRIGGLFVLDPAQADGAGADGGTP